MHGNSAKRTFHVALIKPSHYDADGYLIQWRRSYIPCNSLARVYALSKHCAQTHTLGPDIEIEIEAFEECNNFGMCAPSPSAFTRPTPA